MTDDLKFRTASGEVRSLEPIPASRLKNAPGAIVDQAAAGRPVVITKHGTKRVVVISFDDFQALARARDPGLGALEARFDALFEGMQKPSSKRAAEAAFAASSEELGQAAVEAARTSRKARRRSA